jgi:hypothetical protein
MGSIGWRMGAGEDYSDDFSRWWSGQTRALRLKVKAVYPEPEDWGDFYNRLR